MAEPNKPSLLEIKLNCINSTHNSLNIEKIERKQSNEKPKDLIEVE